MKATEKYKAIYSMTCRTGCRISEKFWSMKIVLWSQGETLRQRIETLPVLLTNYQWSHEQQWNRVAVSMVSTRTFPKNPNCDICMKSKTTEASCRRRAGTVLPRAENFGDMITADHRGLCRKWIAQQSSTCRGGARFGTAVVTILPL